MRQNMNHNYATIELISLLTNKSTRAKTINFLNESEHISLKVDEESEKMELTLSTNSGGNINVNGSFYQLLMNDGIIDLIVDSLAHGTWKNRYQELYDFRDSIVTEDMYNELIKKYAMLIYNNQGKNGVLIFDNDDKFDINLAANPIFGNLNQLFIQEVSENKYAGILLHPRKHSGQHIVGNNVDDLKKYNKASNLMRYNLYSYLLSAYQDFKDDREA